MKLQVSSSKNTQLYYVAKSFRTENGKYSSKIIERLGTMEDLIARFGDEDTLRVDKRRKTETAGGRSKIFTRTSSFQRRSA